MPAALGEGLYALTAVSAAGGMTLTLLGKKGRFTGVLRYFLSLVLILMLLLPLFRVVRSAENMFHTADTGTLPEPILYAATAEYAGSIAERELCRLLSRETGIPEDGMEVTLTLSDGGNDGTVITESAVTFTDRRYRIGAGEVRVRMEELLSCPCTVRYREKAEDDA